MKQFKGTKGMIVLLVLMCMLVCYYFYLANRQEKPEEEAVETTAIQEVLLRDLDKNYPASPKEVIKYYSELTKCFYNEEPSKEELKRLSDRAMEMYDADLAANQTGEYENELKEDIISFKEGGITISSYKVSSSTDVEYYYLGERECSSLYCTYTLKKGTSLLRVEEEFILRKDEEGHWKILGWKETKLDQ